jgi:hypothetical protein
VSFNTRVGTDASALLASSKDTASACPLEAAANRALTPDLLVEVLKVKIKRIKTTIIINNDNNDNIYTYSNNDKNNTNNNNNKIMIIITMTLIKK